MIELFAALVLFAQGPSGETPTDTAAPPAAGAAAAPKTAVQIEAEKNAKLDKVVCHEESVVGSRFPRKVCQSKRAEAIKRQEDQETVRHMQDMTPIISH